MKWIIALGHKSRVGKDLGGTFLSEQLRSMYPNKTVRRVAFADRLKDVCHNLFKFTGLESRYHYEENPAERSQKLDCGLTPVELWVRFGTDWCRSIDPFVWCRIIDEHERAGTDILIITDLRFPNEAEYIRNRDCLYTLVKINRTQAQPLNSVADAALDGYTDWTHIIDNNGTIPEYHKALMDLVAREAPK